VSYQQRLELFPVTTQRVTAGTASRLAIAGCDLVALAETYGTPLYLYDQATMEAAAQAYRQALAKHYPGEAGVTYAGKAFLCLAAAQWVTWQGFWLDCTGAGELHIATAAAVPRRSILMHGVNKSAADLEAGLAQAGVIVVDNLAELERLATQMAPARESRPNLWLRVKPGVAVDTHAYRQTGQEESKFGLSPGEAMQAVARCQALSLPLTGLHFHQGSHFHDPAPIGPALATVLDLVAHLAAETGWQPQTLSPGGGWGVAYHEDELPHPAIDSYVRFIATALVAGCQERGLNLPRLQVEPGRSLVARAGVALYRVGVVKAAGERRWVLLDGGMADNPRPALYGARYSALPVEEPARPNVGPAWLAGPYCESGDVLIENLPLPALAPGELVAVPVSGAYHLMMGSNYNGARKPAVIWLHQGQANLIQRREEMADLVMRDRRLPQAEAV
jgi:diaminopimelate decarboxylase